METRPDGVFAREVIADTVAAAIIDAAPPPSRRALPPKGSCWYCDKPLDSVRRFCGRECGAAFDEDAALHG